MERKPRILLLATGGTIASVLYEYGLAPGLKAEQLLSYIPEARETYTMTMTVLSSVTERIRWHILLQHCPI